MVVLCAPGRDLAERGPVIRARPTHGRMASDLRRCAGTTGDPSGGRSDGEQPHSGNGHFRGSAAVSTRDTGAPSLGSRRIGLDLVSCVIISSPRAFIPSGDARITRECEEGRTDGKGARPRANPRLRPGCSSSTLSVVERRGGQPSRRFAGPRLPVIVSRRLRQGLWASDLAPDCPTSPGPPTPHSCIRIRHRRAMPSQARPPMVRVRDRPAGWPTPPRRLRIRWRVVPSSQHGHADDPLAIGVWYDFRMEMRDGVLYGNVWQRWDARAGDMDARAVGLAAGLERLAGAERRLGGHVHRRDALVGAGLVRRRPHHRRLNPSVMIRPLAAGRT